jgi:hypothetical protein
MRHVTIHREEARQRGTQARHDMMVYSLSFRALCLLVVICDWLICRPNIVPIVWHDWLPTNYRDININHMYIMILMSCSIG